MMKSNRLHGLLYLLLIAAASGVAAAPRGDSAPRVLSGIDVLRSQNFAPLAQKRVGLVTNHTGLAADGATTIDLLFKSGVCKLIALFYPGVCLLEGANVSVGRGTDRPFEVVGAPWIEPRRLAAALRESAVPGIEFVPVFFTPASSNYRGQQCGGVNLILTDRSRFNSVQAGLSLISVLRRLYGEQFGIDKTMRLLGSEQVLSALKKGDALAEVIRLAGAGIGEFLEKRRKALIYPQ